MGLSLLLMLFKIIGVLIERVFGFRVILAYAKLLSLTRFLQKQKRKDQKSLIEMAINGLKEIYNLF
jgi:hypothetical protein